MTFATFPPEPSDWGASLRARLFEQRIVFVRGALDDEVAGRVAMELMTLDATGDSAVQLHIDCPSAELGAAMSVMDVIDTMGVNVTGVALGIVGGPAIGVLAACHHRVAMPNARFHLCEPEASFSGDATTIERWLEDRRRQWDRYCERLGRALAMPSEELDAVLSGGPYLGAEEAVALGLVHEVARAKGAISPLRPGFRA